MDRGHKMVECHQCKQNIIFAVEKIDSVSELINCPFCGTKLHKRYSELQARRKSMETWLSMARCRAHTLGQTNLDTLEVRTLEMRLAEIQVEIRDFLERLKAKEGAM